MLLYELFLIAVGLSMDAFAVSVCKGLAMSTSKMKNALIVGLYFGLFQAIMPMIGYFLGVGFSDFISSYDHWVAFGLLLFIGGKMIIEALKKDEEENISGTIKFREMIILSIATSIDALAAGVTFAFLSVNIFAAAAFIGITTFVLSSAGVKIGSVFGAKFKSPAELAGGIILVLMGIKILLEHLGILNI